MVRTVPRVHPSNIQRLSSRIELVWAAVHGPLHHHARRAVADRVAVTLFYLTHCDGYDCAGQVFGMGRTPALRFTTAVINLLVGHCLQATLAFHADASS